MNYKNIKEILKKFWFVILVGTILVSVSIFFVWDTTKDTIVGKTVDGKDVIFSLSDENYTADDYYKGLYNTTTANEDGVAIKNGDAYLYTLLEKEVISQSVKTTDALKKEANKIFKANKEGFEAQMGSQYESYIDAEMKKLGYSGIDDFETFYLDLLKAQLFQKKYIESHEEISDLIFNDTESARVLAHIFVSSKTPDAPTDTEKNKMETINSRLKTDDFGKVAKDLSDDSGSASNNGNVGVQIKSSELTDAYKAVAWKLAAGETSEWVKTDDGFYLIQVVETDQKKILKNSDYDESVVEAVTLLRANFKREIVWEKSKELKVKFADEETKKSIMTYIGVKEEE
ncbi:MAG: peptidylprolyl isomerase [Breznakia sp.]